MRGPYLLLSACGVIAMLGMRHPFAGVVTLDGTLGGVARSLDGPDFRIEAADGRQAGTNLFHSLGRFEIGADESATFAGPGGILRVIVRVTGEQRSLVEGVLRTELADGGDLWLLNPAGWHFGPSARLELQGSLYLSGGDYLGFAGGRRFEADPAKGSSLAISPPESFGFHYPQSGTIQIDGTRLGLTSGATLALVGGEIVLTNAALSAPGGDLWLYGGGGPGEWHLAEGTQGMIQTPAPGPITIDGYQTTDEGIKRPSLDVGGSEPGAIRLHGGEVRLQDAFLSAVRIGDAPDSGAAPPSEAILVTAVGTLLLTGDTYLQADSHATGPGGDIVLHAGAMGLSDDARIGTGSHWSGDAGAVRIAVAGDMTMQGDARLEAYTLGDGDAGDLEIEAGTLNMAGMASLRSVTYGAGDAGAIRLTADSIRLGDSTTIDVATFPGSRGAGGSIRVEADTLLLEGDSALSSGTYGEGRGGDIVVEAGEVALAGGADLRALGEGGGAAGSIDLQVRGLLEVTDARITTESLQSDGGPIQVQAGALLLRNAELATSVLGEQGDGGDIAIEAGVLALDGGFIQANTAATGAVGGEIRIEAPYLMASGGAVAVGGEVRRQFATGSGENVIQAAAPDGVGGEIRIHTLGIDPDTLMGLMGAEFSSPLVIAQDPCAAPAASTLVGRGSRVLAPGWIDSLAVAPPCP